MEMESRVDIALEKRSQGYNCSQAIVCTYCDLFGIDEETAYKISESLGAGMATMEGTCGALTGVFLLASLKNSGGLSMVGKTKGSTYSIIRELKDEFKEMNTSIICRELKGLDDGIIKRSCAGCVQDAALMVEKFLLND